MKDQINKKALELFEKYKAEYIEFCQENPGCIMHGASIKQDALRKASFAETVKDLYAMRRCYEIQLKSMENKPNGFIFYRDAIDELIKELKLSGNKREF